ncbi:hypothetical protein [Rhodococcus oxybenzonivorans]|uniref:hypothetical protein n=1 Tax=Rhodococcus oxybenzonivorans TaxID=1990687 RepID=UPI00194EA90A|nr:hypothetical protein [Rhodococcus oxybenzonivorans]
MVPHPVEVEQIHHELVRILGLDAELRQLRIGEVPQVRRDDHLRPGADRRGQHMAVVLIRQRERGDECLVAGDQGSPEPPAFISSRSFVNVAVGMSGRSSAKFSNVSPEDAIRPPGMHQAGLR